jgi:hypothetical protein
MRTVQTLSLSLLCILTLAPRGLAAEPQKPQARVAGLQPFQTDVFPILPWSKAAALTPAELDRSAGLGSIAECNFTLSGFVQKADVPACEKLGLRAIVYPEKVPHGKDWAHMTAEQAERWAAGLIEGTQTSKAVFGYYLVDEPGTSAFANLGRAVAYIKKHAPGKLAYINLFPGYATIGAPDMSQLEAGSFTEYLERYVREVRPQFISYDNYMVEMSMDMKEAPRAAKYWSDLLEVRRMALEHDLPFWNIVTCNQIRPHTTVPSPANLLMQAWTTLAAGGKGVSWFYYFTRGYAFAPISPDNHRSATWQYLQMVNRQLKTVGPMMLRLRSTGVYFAPGVATASAPAGGGAAVGGTSASAAASAASGAPSAGAVSGEPSGGAASGVPSVGAAGSVRGMLALPGKLVTDVAADGPMMVGEFSGPGGERWAVLVNTSLERSVRCVPKLQDATLKIYVVSPEDGSIELADLKRGIWLPAGQGQLVQLK